MIDIFKTIREERTDFLNNEIEVVPGYTFSQYNTIKKVHLYFNSQYEKGNYEEVNGVTRKKVFHNISKWRCEVATKMLDIDVKDFILVGNNPDQDLQVHMLEKELKVWLKKHELGQKLNEIVRKLPVYGSVVIKKHNKGVQIIDLRHFYIDQAASSLKDARYINIKNFMSLGELRKMKGKWDDVETAIDRFQNSHAPGYDQSQGETKVSKPEGSPYVEVWERYGEVPLSWFSDKSTDDNEWVLAKFVVAGIDNVSKNDKGVIMEEEGVILFKEQLTELPLKEVHYNKTEGRWLGIGIVEDTFEPQRRINEIKNQEARALELGSLQIFQTRDEGATTNILTDVDNGQILTTKSEITPIATESRELAGFQEAFNSNDQLADRLTFSYDVVRGEAAPASATLGSLQLQSQQATSVYDYKKENIGLFLGEYVKDIVFPQIGSEINKEHFLRYSGDITELKNMKLRYARNKARRKQWEQLFNGEEVQEEQLLIEECMKEFQSNDKLWMKIVQGFYKNLDYEVDIVISGENKNIFSQVQNAQGVLALLQDPEIFTNPAKRQIAYQALSGLGMHISQLEEIDNNLALAEGMQPSPMQLPALAQPNGQQTGPTNTY